MDKNNVLGLLLHPLKSIRHPAQYITDLDFADDLAIPANTVENAESLLHALEEAAAYVGLYCNASKTEFTSSASDPTIKTTEGIPLKHVPDFKYLGSHIMTSAKDFRIRKALAWNACNKLDKLWKSNLPNTIKINFFRSTVEWILLYGSETWTLNSQLHKRLDGCYTNLLRRVQNISWKTHPTLETIYGKIPKLSLQLSQRRTRFAGHCFRAKDELNSDLILWKASNSRKLTYPDIISRDTSIPVKDLPTAMMDKDVWRQVVQGISPKGER